MHFLPSLCCRGGGRLGCQTAYNSNHHCHRCYGVVDAVNHHVIGLQCLLIQYSKRCRLLYLGFPVWSACDPDCCVGPTGVDSHFFAIYAFPTCYSRYADADCYRHPLNRPAEHAAHPCVAVKEKRTNTTFKRMITEETGE